MEKFGPRSGGTTNQDLTSGYPKYCTVLKTHLEYRWMMSSFCTQKALILVLEIMSSPLLLLSLFLSMLSGVWDEPIFCEKKILLISYIEKCGPSLSQARKWTLRATSLTVTNQYSLNYTSSQPGLKCLIHNFQHGPIC